jgi:hypothetical protein
VPMIVGLDINLDGTLIASGNTLGNVQLGRNWTRNNTTGLFTHNTRRLIFNSALNSIINLTATGTETFYAVEFDKISSANTIASANTITLSKPVDISNSAIFGKGIVVSTGTNILSFFDDATATGASQSSFVNGPVRKIGNDAFNFPVGKFAVNTTAISNPSVNVKVGGYRPIGIGLPTASETFTAEYQLANPTVWSISNNARTAGLQSISRCEYWDLARSGTAHAAVTLSWSSHPDGQSQCNVGPYVINPISLHVVPYFNNQWGDEFSTFFGNTSVSGTATPTGPEFLSFITWDGMGGIIDRYEKFVLGTTNWQNAPLPADIKQFTAKGIDKKVALNWLVSNNQDVKYYTIERSRNGFQFENIKQVTSRYNETTGGYADLDPTPFNGWNYYRLRITDVSGNISYSSIQKVWMGQTITQIQLSPNPAKDRLWISLAEPEKITEISIVNSIGQLLLKQNRLMTTNQLNIAGLQPGIYYVRIVGQNGITSEPFVKE